MFRRFLLLGSANMFLAVALGAFGAHSLKAVLDEGSLDVFETGVRYHMMHALGLLALAWLADRWPGSRLLSAAGWLLFAGIVLFSGSLYALSMTGVKAFGPVTPLGGLSFLAGWAFVFAAVWQKKKSG